MMVSGTLYWMSPAVVLCFIGSSGPRKCPWRLPSFYRKDKLRLREVNKITQSHTTKNWSRRILKEGRPNPSLPLPASSSSSYFSIYIYFLALITPLHTYVFSLSLSTTMWPHRAEVLVYFTHWHMPCVLQWCLACRRGSALPEWLPHRLHGLCPPPLRLLNWLAHQPLWQGWANYLPMVIASLWPGFSQPIS